MAWFSRARISDTELAALIRAPGLEVYALVVNGRDEGLLELDFREAGQCQLTYFGVTGSLIGAGAARFLMNRALELAWSRDLRRVWVHTCTLDHPSAVAFYQRSGFRPFRRQIDNRRLASWAAALRQRNQVDIFSVILFTCYFQLFACVAIFEET